MPLLPVRDAFVDEGMVLSFIPPLLQKWSFLIISSLFLLLPSLKALKERKEMMKSEPRYDMNQGGLLCDEPWFDLCHLSFVTSYVAWATMSATLNGLRCMGYVAWATLHGLRCQLCCKGYVVTCYVIWATLHGLRWQLHCMGYVA